MPWHTVSPYDGVGTGGSITFTGTTQLWAFIWIATARDITTDGTVVGHAVNDATRTSTRCYMRGLRENVYINVANNRPVRWRRICFTFRGLELLTAALNNGGTGAQGVFWNNEQASNPNSGYHRNMTQIRPSSGDALVLWQQLLTVVYKGVFDKDWLDPMSAALDNSRVTPKYDRTRVLRSGNDVGTMNQFKLWHPMNSTLVYNDEEIGGDTQLGTVLSANTKFSMGDYYVLDLFDFGPGFTTDDGIQLSIESTLYWHER